MSAYSAPFQSNALRIVARIAALLTPLACSDSTEPSPVPARYVVTSSSSLPLAGDSVVLNAQLVDAENKAVRLAGRIVNWTSDAGHGRLNTASTVTSADGSSLTLYITDTTAGVVQKVVAADLSGVSGVSPDIVPIAGPPVKYSVEPSSFSPTVRSDVLVSAQLADRYGNAAKEAGRTVVWSTDVTGPARGSFSSPTSTTNADGIAAVTYTVGTVANVPFQLVVVDNRLLEGRSKTLTAQPGTATKYVVTPSVVDPPAGADVMITAQMTDVLGNASPVFGRLVTWTKTGSAGSFSSPMTATDENGRATVALSTASVVGNTYTVSASDAGGLSGTSDNITTTQQVSLESVASGFGGSTACGIATDGKAWCWGGNYQGVLGNGNFADRSVPGKVSGGQTMTSISVGLSHACGIASGVVLCWGENQQGQLGDNSTTPRPLPAPVNASLSFTAVSAGTNHTCAIASSGNAYCWGLRETYRLGDAGSGNIASTPVSVAGGLSFVAISAGVDHTCGITASGDAYCWGVNALGKLGDNSVTPSAIPRAVVGGLRFTSIGVGEMHTCGISAGKAYCWGDNHYGQLGTPGPPKSTPTAVGGGLTFAQISVGGFHTCGIAADGQAYCWGNNETGQLGNPSNPAAGTTVPTLVAGGLTFKSISVGGGMVVSDDYYYYYDSSPAGHSCAVTLAGVTYCWGSNSHGQLGIGALTAQSATPMKVAGQP